jgi:hypothetical protein
MLALYIVSFVILLFAVYIAAMNWGCFIATIRNQRLGIDKYHSTVPFAAFFITAFAIIFYPGPNRYKVWMLAVPILDIGSWLLPLALLWLPVRLIRDSRHKNTSESPASIDTDKGIGT